MRNLDPIAVVYLAFFGFLVPLMVIRGGSRGRAGIGNPPGTNRPLKSSSWNYSFF